MKYRKKSKVIEAFKFDGDFETAFHIDQWVKSGGARAILKKSHKFKYVLKLVFSDNKEVKVIPNHWIIKDGNEFETMQDRLFKAFYEVADEQDHKPIEVSNELTSILSRIENKIDLLMEK